MNIYIYKLLSPTVGLCWDPILILSPTEDTYIQISYMYICIKLQLIALVTHRWHAGLPGPTILPEKAGPAKTSHANAL